MSDWNTHDTVHCRRARYKHTIIVASAPLTGTFSGREGMRLRKAHWVCIINPTGYRQQQCKTGHQSPLDDDQIQILSGQVDP